MIHKSKELDTHGYPDGYAVAFANIRYLLDKYDLPFKHWHDMMPRDCHACIRTDHIQATDLILGESYAVHLSYYWPHFDEVIGMLENYPVFDDELCRRVEHQLFSQALPSILEIAAEDEGYCWLREWYVQKYYSLEQVEHPLFGRMYPPERAMIDAMSRTTLDVLRSCIVYDCAGYARPVQSGEWANFKGRLREDLFTFANNTRKERMYGWKKNWHTLPGIGG